jgi:hypothetical protein
MKHLKKDDYTKASYGAMKLQTRISELLARIKAAEAIEEDKNNVEEQDQPRDQD